MAGSVNYYTMKISFPKDAECKMTPGTLIQIHSSHNSCALTPQAVIKGIWRQNPEEMPACHGLCFMHRDIHGLVGYSLMHLLLPYM